MFKSLAILTLLFAFPAQFLTPHSAPRKLFILGDSTAASYDISRHPFMGWGQVLQHFLNPDSIQVENRAISGRSSKSFYVDTWGWPWTKPQINAGDIVFIQFGHNDAKSDTSLHTDPFTTYKAYLKKYVDESRAIGAFPVLLTPIHQNVWTSDNLFIINTHGDYPTAMRQLAISENVPLLDMTNRTESLFESLGKDRTTWEVFFNLKPEIYSRYPEGKADNTHLQEYGAYEISNLITDELRSLSTHGEIARIVSVLYPMQKVHVGTEPADRGYIKGPRYFSPGKKHTIQAVPALGYTFSHWSQSGRVIYKNSPYSFSVDQGDVAVRFAHFTIPVHVPAGTSLNTDSSDTTDTNLSTSIRLNVHETGIALYPSPADQVLTISYSADIQTISIVNMTGQQVYQVDVAGRRRYTIETHLLPPGIYGVELRARDQVFHRKVMIRR